MINKYLGMSDIPLTKDEKDYLDTKKHVEGLVKFATECCTPMSIALQGEWGTGKTSFINRMIGQLDENKIITVYFNTWQYSQFNMSDNLYYSLMQCIINSIKEKSKQPLIADKVLKSLRNVVFDFSKQLLERYTGMKIDAVIEDMNKRNLEKMENIKELKYNYKKLINDVAGIDGRVVIFIDDLDRLNPDIAVALLETIKLFMDVEKSVFVLAIDYDVVVRGIRAKYGADMDDMKCKSFFDKIIQLPFRMPTEKYQIKNMLGDESLQGQFDGYTNILDDLTKNTLGTNPRTFKRIINSYELLKTIEEKKDDPYEATLLLISIIFQLHASDFYTSFFNDVCYGEDFDINDFNSFKEENKNKELIEPIFKALDELKNSSKKGDQVIKDFKNVVTATGDIISLSSSERKEATKVTKIVVFGIEHSVDSAAEATLLTVQEILERCNKATIDKIIEKQSGSITTDCERNNSKFRNKKEINVKDYPNTIYLGVSSGYGDKINLVKKISSIANIKEGSIKWYDNDDYILLSI